MYLNHGEYAKNIRHTPNRMISRSLLFNKDMDLKCKNNDNNNNNNNINNNNTYNLLENIMREDSVTSMDLNLTGFYLVCGTRLSNIVFYDVFTNSIGHNIQLYNKDTDKKNKNKKKNGKSFVTKKSFNKKSILTLQWTCKSTDVIAATASYELFQIHVLNNKKIHFKNFIPTSAILSISTHPKINNVALICCLYEVYFIKWDTADTDNKKIIQEKDLLCSICLIKDDTKQFSNSFSMATFNKSNGKYIYISQGQIETALHVFDTETKKCLYKETNIFHNISTSNKKYEKSITDICTSLKCDKYLLVERASSELFLYDVEHICKEENHWYCVAHDNNNNGETSGDDYNNLISTNLVLTFEDTINKSKFSSCGFSTNDTYIYASLMKSYTIFVWDIFQGGRLIRTITDPSANDDIYEIAYHPHKASMFVLTVDGEISYWDRKLEHSYVPYEVIKDNLEYIEREDEFDIVPIPSSNSIKTGSQNEFNHIISKRIYTEKNKQNNILKNNNNSNGEDIITDYVNIDAYNKIQSSTMHNKILVLPSVPLQGLVKKTISYNNNDNNKRRKMNNMKKDDVNMTTTTYNNKIILKDTTTTVSKHDMKNLANSDLMPSSSSSSSTTTSQSSSPSVDDDNNNNNNNDDNVKSTSLDEIVIMKEVAENAIKKDDKIVEKYDDVQDIQDILNSNIAIPLMMEKLEGGVVIV